MKRLRWLRGNSASAHRRCSPWFAHPRGSWFSSGCPCTYSRRAWPGACRVAVGPCASTTPLPASASISPADAAAGGRPVPPSTNLHAADPCMSTLSSTTLGQEIQRQRATDPCMSTRSSTTWARRSKDSALRGISMVESARWTKGAFGVEI